MTNKYIYIYSVYILISLCSIHLHTHTYNIYIWYMMIYACNCMYGWGSRWIKSDKMSISFNYRISCHLTANCTGPWKVRNRLVAKQFALRFYGVLCCSQKIGGNNHEPKEPGENILWLFHQRTRAFKIIIDCFSPCFRTLALPYSDSAFQQSCLMSTSRSDQNLEPRGFHRRRWLWQGYGSFPIITY